jgi:hypothetical protein
MSTPLRAVARGALSPALLILGLVAAGCASDDRPPRGPGGRPAHAQTFPTLTGKETFFTGRIVAEVRIGAMAGFDRTGNGEARGGGEGHAREGGRRHHGGGGMGGGGYGGPSPERETGERPPSSLARAGNTGSPPVEIHLRFTNTGPAPVTLEIPDFNSPLGNFVVEPASLKLDPGQSAEVEPMSSQLATDAISGEISLSLRLDGAKETKVVTVQAEPAPKSPAAAGN